MDITDESGGRRDAQSTLATVTVTSEARIRTLNNKVSISLLLPQRLSYPASRFRPQKVKLFHSLFLSSRLPAVKNGTPEVEH